MEVVRPACGQYQLPGTTSFRKTSLRAAGGGGTVFYVASMGDGAIYRNSGRRGQEPGYRRLPGPRDAHQGPPYLPIEIAATNLRPLPWHRQPGTP